MTWSQWCAGSAFLEPQDNDSMRAVSANLVVDAAFSFVSDTKHFSERASFNESDKCTFELIFANMISKSWA